MQHAVEPLSNHVPHGIVIEQIGDHEPRLRRHRLAVAALEIVEHDDLVPGPEQPAAHDRADVTGAAGDKQLHRRVSKA